MYIITINMDSSSATYYLTATSTVLVTGTVFIFSRKRSYRQGEWAVYTLKASINNNIVIIINASHPRSVVNVAVNNLPFPERGQLSVLSFPCWPAVVGKKEVVVGYYLFEKERQRVFFFFL